MHVTTCPLGFRNRNEACPDPNVPLSIVSLLPALALVRYSFLSALHVHFLLKANISRPQSGIIVIKLVHTCAHTSH